MKAFLLLSLALLLGCKKNKPAPADQLPPATQTGANTFGCLLNGQPWLLTYGYLGSTPQLRVTYDPSYTGGSLQIMAYRIVLGLPEGQDMFIVGSSISSPGTYAMSSVGPAGVSYSTGL